MFKIFPGKHYFKYRNYSKALYWYSHAINIDPWNKRVQSELRVHCATIHMEQYKFQKAIELLTEALELDPANNTAYTMRAQCQMPRR